MKLVIKVGTQSILGPDGAFFEKILRSLVAQIVALKQEAHHIIFVSSGAVALGRRVAREILNLSYGDSLEEKQMLASLGQHELMHAYAALFKEHGKLVAQVLLTKQDFQTRKHYLNIARILRETEKNKDIIPIVNENDSVSIEELMFTDNDELAGLIAAQMNADKLIILTNVKGVYDKSPHEPDARLISIIDPQKGWPEVSSLKSSQGRGGMSSKLATARKMAALGIMTHIASVEEENVILRLVKGKNLGSTILPRQKKSNIKKWIAFNEDKQNGAIHINTCLFDILKENKRIVSILPVGIEKYRGDFKKGDLVKIISPNGDEIGFGIAQYGAEKLEDVLGVKGKKTFIHYDHLYIKIGA